MSRPTDTFRYLFLERILLLAILHVLLCCASEAAFIPSSFGSHKRQTCLCAKDDRHPLDRDDPTDYSSPPARPDEKVYINIFKPNTQDEGAHTIEYPKGSGNNVILAFSSRRECDKFANLLREQEPSWAPVVCTL